MDPPTSPPLHTHLAPSLAHDAGHTELPAVPKIADLFPASGPWLVLFPLPRALLHLSVWLAPSHPSCFTLRRAFFKGPSASHPVPHGCSLSASVVPPACFPPENLLRCVNFKMLSEAGANFIGYILIGVKCSQLYFIIILCHKKNNLVFLG